MLTHGMPCILHHRPLPCIVTHGLPCVTHMVLHVSSTWFSMCHPHGSPCVTHMDLYMSPTWLAMCCLTPVTMCHPHGSPCVTHMVRHVSPTWISTCHPHGLPCVARHSLPRKMRNYDYLEIQRNSSRQLNFTRRTQ